MTVHSAFVQPHSSKAGDDSPSWDVRLARLEDIVQVLFESIKELASALDNQQAALDILAKVPGDVSSAMKALADDQSKVNLTLSAKIDMNRGLITDLQDTVEDLRGEVAELDDDPIEMDNMFADGDPVFNFGIESHTFHPDEAPIFADLPFKMLDAGTYEYKSRVLLADEEENEYDHVKTEGDYVVIVLPTPVHADGMTMEDFDEGLQGIVYDAFAQELISGEVAQALLSGIAGGLTYEEARAVLPQIEVPGVVEAMQEWWTCGESGDLNVIKTANIEAAVTQAVAGAYVAATMFDVATKLFEAFNEE